MERNAVSVFRAGGRPVGPQSARKVAGLQVEWCRGSNNNKNKLGNVGGMLGSWLGGGGGGGRSDSDNNNRIPSKFVWVDGGGGDGDQYNNNNSWTPELHVQPVEEQQSTDAAATNDSDAPSSIPKVGFRLRKSAGYSKTIPLKDMSRVEISKDDGNDNHTLTIHGAAASPDNNDDNSSSPQKSNKNTTILLQFQVKHPSELQDVHDALVELVAFERRRQSSIPEHERSLQQQHKNGIRERAQKAAHFAKREMELTQQRRQREERKQKYMKETGGLKYTALAMAAAKQQQQQDEIV